MKTQLEVKMEERSLFDKTNQAAWTAGKKKRKRPPGDLGRWALCALLIGILAASGLSGAGVQRERQVSAAPVISRTISGKTDEQTDSYDETVKRIEDQREKELMLLDDVLRDEQADAQTKQQALTQKLELVKRLEVQASVEDALAHMGFVQAAAISMQERLMIILPSGTVEEGEMVQVIDTVCSVSGCEAKDVKIILAKK